jgi:general secretion pathway protein J
MSRQSQRGVTLIELLVAITMLSLLSVGILMAMRMGLATLSRTKAHLIANRKVQSVTRILEHQLNGLMPVRSFCMTAGGGPAPVIGFFQGEPQTMRLVSSYSLDQAGRGYPQVLEYQVIPGEDGRGVRLVVNEHPYSGPLATSRFCAGVGMDAGLGRAVPFFVPVETGSRSFVLADRLARCRFFYREPLRMPPLSQWTPRWTQPGWPQAIRVEMEPLEADNSRLQVGTVTVPIPIRRDPNELYADE